jgi:hypothetical protein
MRSSLRALWSSSALCGLAASLLCAGAPKASADETIAPPATPTTATEPADEAARSVLSVVLKDKLGLTASLRAAGFSKDKSFSGDVGYGVGSLWVTASPQAVLGIRFYLDARAQAQDVPRSSSVLFDLREAYGQWSFGGFDLKAGRQITVWGRADAVNPTDVWSTRDFKLLAPNDDDQHLGVASVQAGWSVGDYHLIAIWQPEWRYPGLPVPPLPPGVSFTNVAPIAPEHQFGGKLDHSGADIDWSISYAHAIDRTPDIAVLPAMAPALSLGFRYRFVDRIGADAAVPIGKFGLRGEVAYARTHDTSGTDPLTKNSNLFAVVGAERTFDGVLNINVQYLYRLTFDFVSLSSIADPNTRYLAEQVDLISNQLAPNMHGASTRIGHKAFNETLESEIAAVIWFNKPTSAALRPKVTYAFTDHLKGVVGAEIYLGPGDSFFGRLSPTSAGYAELQFGF